MRSQNRLSATNVSFSDLEVVKTIFQTLPIPMIIIDKHENIIFLNDAYKSYLHVKNMNFLGKNVHQFISNSRLPMVLRTKKPLFGVYHKYVDSYSRDLEAVCNLIPVIKNGEAIACFGIVVFQNMYDLFSLTLQNKQLQNDLEQYKKELSTLKGAKYSIDSILGDSQSIKEMKNTIYKLAESPSTVLITGESGSGKELVAYSIHQYSHRNTYPMICVNCASIPENLLESELFGYTGGSFTGAKRNGSMGKFEAANHGTLFLDEIGELPLFAQAKLLRVLQEKEVTRVGGNAPIPIDVRVITATNRNLEQMVQDGQFREDLYYRLNILNINVPPLRDRKSDIPILIRHFLDKLSQTHGIAKELSKSAEDVLIDYDWPGNIRELSNIIERIYYMSDSNTIELHDIPSQIIKGHVNIKAKNSAENNSLDTMLSYLERDIVMETLKKTNYNISQTASQLQIPRSRLYRILKRHNLTRKF